MLEHIMIYPQMSVTRGIHRIQRYIVTGQIVQRDIQINAKLVTASRVHIQFLIKRRLHVVEELQKYKETNNAGTYDGNYIKKTKVYLFV